MSKIAKDDKFLKSLEDAVTAVLDNPKTKSGERIKAVEVGSRLLMIRHRIEGGGGDDSGSFFDK